MVYLRYKSCLRYTIQVGNPQNVSGFNPFPPYPPSPSPWCRGWAAQHLLEYWHGVHSLWSESGMETFCFSNLSHSLTFYSPWFLSLTTLWWWENNKTFLVLFLCLFWLLACVSFFFWGGGGEGEELPVLWSLQSTLMHSFRQPKKKKKIFFSGFHTSVFGAADICFMVIECI